MVVVIEVDQLAELQMAARVAASEETPSIRSPSLTIPSEAQSVDALIIQCRIEGIVDGAASIRFLRLDPCFGEHMWA